MKYWKLWAGVVLALALVGAGLYGWWKFDLRWRPKTVTKHATEIAKILEQSGWVSNRVAASPGGKPPKVLYMISYRTCPDCVRFEKQEFPKLHKAGVETRVIIVARPDKNGVVRSTAAERATIAEIWANRRTGWALLERWTDANPDAWTAAGIPPADGDIGRTALVDVGRKTVSDLTPMMRDNGVKFAYPLLVWWTKDGEMKSCACEKAETYRFVRHDLDA